MPDRSGRAREEKDVRAISTSTSTVSVGIHDISTATGHYALPLETLAAQHGIDPQKFLVGIGQEAMSLPAEDEDPVTLAASAAAPILARHGAENIRTVLFATETGVDQSTAAGVYVHSLLGLPHTARTVELKQACYSGTAALQFAASLVARDPSQQVLVIASDIARYALDSGGEPTQGAGAVAMLVAADPAVLELDPFSGVYTRDIPDFWRPNYLSTALVDGKLSIRAYIDALTGAWRDYREHGGRAFEDLATICYHQPFTKMAVKAHVALAEVAGQPVEKDVAAAQLADTLHYNRLIGNSYTASMYYGLASLLDHREDLAGQAVGLASYGSGSVSEFFSGTVRDGYRSHGRAAETRAGIEAREVIDYARYRELHEREVPVDGGEHELPRVTRAPFRLAGYSGHRRLYERNA